MGHPHIPRLLAKGGLLLALLASATPGWAQSPDPALATGPAAGSAADATRELAPRLTTAEWRAEIRASADRFAGARALHRRALAVGLDRGTRIELAQEAATLDPQYAAPHLTLARLRLGGGKVAGFTDLLEWGQRRLGSYRAQSRAAANVLLGINAVMGGLLLWFLFSLVLRYLPFFHHAVAARLDASGHAEHRYRALWLPVMLPFGLLAGLVPTLAMILPAVWLLTRRRSRVILGLLVGWFALQGLWPAPFGSILLTLDPLATTTLAHRAFEDPPTETLLRDLREASAARPGDPRLHASLGLALSRAGKFEESNQSLLAALELESDAPRVLNNLAANHFYLGHVDRAVSGFQQAAALDGTLGAVHHNLSQAYIRKLFFKEAGTATQLALQNGFSAERRPDTLPQGAAYYEWTPTAGLWQSAWEERGRVAPLDVLAPWSRWLGTPVDHIGWWLGIALLLSLVLGRLVSRAKVVFECANCADLACDRCHGEHEGIILCTACGATAKRARSEVVLRTLLRNRRHEAEGRFAKRVRGLNGFLFGLGNLYDGARPRGFLRGIFLMGLLVAAWHPHPFVADPWDPLPLTTWSWIRIAALLGLAILASTSWWNRYPDRARSLHLHPSNLVSLVDLMDGRPRRKANA